MLEDLSTCFSLRDHIITFFVVKASLLSKLHVYITFSYHMSISYFIYGFSYVLGFHISFFITYHMSISRVYGFHISLVITCLYHMSISHLVLKLKQHEWFNLNLEIDHTLLWVFINIENWLEQIRPTMLSECPISSTSSG